MYVHAGICTMPRDWVTSLAWRGGRLVPGLRLGLHLRTLGLLRLLELERLPGDAAPDILDVFHDRLKVRSSVVGTRDEDLVVLARFERLLERGNGNKPGSS